MDNDVIGLVAAELQNGLVYARPFPVLRDDRDRRLALYRLCLVDRRCYSAAKPLLWRHIKWAKASIAPFIEANGPFIRAISFNVSESKDLSWILKVLARMPDLQYADLHYVSSTVHTIAQARQFDTVFRKAVRTAASRVQYLAVWLWYAYRSAETGLSMLPCADMVPKSFRGHLSLPGGFARRKLTLREGTETQVTAPLHSLVVDGPGSKLADLALGLGAPSFKALHHLYVELRSEKTTAINLSLNLPELRTLWLRPGINQTARSPWVDISGCRKLEKLACGLKGLDHRQQDLREVLPHGLKTLLVFDMKPIVMSELRSIAGRLDILLFSPEDIMSSISPGAIAGWKTVMPAAQKLAEDCRTAGVIMSPPDLPRWVTDLTLTEDTEENREVFTDRWFVGRVELHYRFRVGAQGSWLGQNMFS